MYDSFGDGWNGASVDISVNGIISHSSIGSSFTTGSSASYNLIVSNGDIISIQVETGLVGLGILK